MGLGQTYLPKPHFSDINPYWQDPRKFWKGFAPEVIPRMSARDFLYATTWEMWREDVQGAYCVKQATRLTVRLNFRIGIVNQIKEIREHAKILKAGISTACWLGACIRNSSALHASTAKSA